MVLRAEEHLLLDTFAGRFCHLLPVSVSPVQVRKPQRGGGSVVRVSWATMSVPCQGGRFQLLSLLSWEGNG